MAGARICHRKIPFPGMGHILWVPLLLGVLVPTTRCQSRVNIPGPYFKYQHQNGTLEFEVDCQIWHEKIQPNMHPGTCSFQVITLMAPGFVDTYEVEKLSEMAKNSSSFCTAKVLLEQESVRANTEAHSSWKSIGRVTAKPDNRPIYSSIHIRARRRENLQLKCLWSYPICAGTRRSFSSNADPYGAISSRNQDCILENASNEAEITLDPEMMRKNFTRNARIQSKMTQSQRNSNLRTINTTLGTNLTLVCRVPNLDTSLNDHVCEWLFRPQNNPTSPPIRIRQTTSDSLPAVLFGAGRLSISSESGKKFCNLDIRRTKLTDQGNWSCAPGPGNNGWIFPSREVELRLDSCSTDEECQRGGYQDSKCHMGTSSPTGAFDSACIHPCDSEKGLEVCRKLPNLVCNGICLPTCEFHPCRSYDACMPHVRSGAFDKQRCVCHEGTFAIKSSDHVQINGCMAPHFGGLSMLVFADNGETQACNFTDKIETESCTFHALEGDNITLICLAARIFPEPQLQILGNNYESFVHSLEGVETTALSGFEGRSQEMKRNHSSDQEPKLVKDYMIEARLLHATKDGHNKATFECHFYSEAQEAKVRVILTVRGQQDPNSNGQDASKSVISTQDAMGVISILLVTLAVVLLVVNLVFIFVRRKWKNQQHQSPNDRESHNATVPMTSVITDVAGTRSDTIYTNATSVTSAAEASNTKVSEKRDSNNEEPIYEDINDKGPSTALDRAGRHENKHIGLGQPGNKPSRFPINTATAALGDSELPPNILPPKHVQHTNLAQIHLGVGDARNEEPGTSAGSLQSTTATSSHAEKLQNDLSGQSTSTNAPLAPELDSAYAIVVG